MDLSPTLRAQAADPKVRAVGINPNHWYAVGWAQDWQPGQVKPIQIWKQAIAVYRATNGTFYALADACPHRGVALHLGQVEGDRLICQYHGWAFAPTGSCVHIPYFPPDQTLPPVCARAYPVQERYGLVWLFPGTATLAPATPLIDIPEYASSHWLKVPISVQFQAHFSICNENAMDVFHGYLHQNLQGWFDPVLEQLEADGSLVRARYRVSYRGQLARWLGLAPRANTTTTQTITLEYRYPHFQTVMPNLSALYLMRLPIAPTVSRSFALFFFKLPFAQYWPPGLKVALGWLIQRFILQRFIAQDRVMVESEQQTYLAHPDQTWTEVNPAIIALQRLTRRQYVEYQQNTRDRQPRPTSGHKAPQSSVSRSRFNQSD